MRAIILAAGNGDILDGVIKCLIRHPRDGRPILAHLADVFVGMEITVVVGYKAVEIIQSYPDFNYVINRDWAITNNAYSLALALDETPCYVISGDMFINSAAVAALDRYPDAALASRRENRTLTAINAVTVEDRIAETYMGVLRNANDTELLGLFKITSSQLLLNWKRHGLVHSNLFCGQTLPIGSQLPPVIACQLPEEAFLHEINTVEDYLRIVESCVTQR